MYDQDFQDWMNTMPIGFFHFLWNQYLLSVKAEESQFPMRGDNFIRITSFTPPPRDWIDEFEEMLNTEQITLEDLIKRREE